MYKRVLICIDNTEHCLITIQKGLRQILQSLPEYYLKKRRLSNLRSSTRKYKPTNYESICSYIYAYFYVGYDYFMLSVFVYKFCKKIFR